MTSFQIRISSCSFFRSHFKLNRRRSRRFDILFFIAFQCRSQITFSTTFEAQIETICNSFQIGIIFIFKATINQFINIFFCTECTGKCFSSDQVVRSQFECKVFIIHSLISIHTSIELLSIHKERHSHNRTQLKCFSCYVCQACASSISFNNFCLNQVTGTCCIFKTICVKS